MHCLQAQAHALVCHKSSLLCIVTHLMLGPARLNVHRAAVRACFGTQST